MIGLPEKISIRLIEAAINYYRDLEPQPADNVLCPRVRQLAEVYGKLIWQKRLSVHADALNTEQRVALAFLPARIKAQM